jgi:uncharacterized delta-60 repeat protein
MFVFLGINFIFAAGQFDTSFSDQAGTNEAVEAIKLQSDGKILLGGAFTLCNNTARNRIARLNADGTLDASFNPGLGANNTIYAIAIQSDGKILIGGDFTTYNGIQSNRIARLNIDGTLDISFNSASGPDNTVYAIAIQNNGKIIIGGSFNKYGNINRSKIAQLNATGTIFAPFNAILLNNEQDSIIYDIKVQSDSKIVVGGKFRGGVERLNTDGTKDASFNRGSGANHSVHALNILNSGKIMIGGIFNAFNGTNAFGVARINANGTIDNGFVAARGLNTYSLHTFSIASQTNGKVLIAGMFRGPITHRFCRLNTDGSFDLSLEINRDIIRGDATSLAVQSNGRILLGGKFTIKNKQETANGGNRIVRIVQ